MDPVSTEEIQRRLLGWFARHRRDLPFRRDRSPYRVLLTEVMSQQTAAEAVGHHLERFLVRFPDVPTLAAAAEQDVLALWQGLGYSRRARNLHRAARMMVERFGGHVPADPADLRALPGVGPYIAAAIGSFAFGRDAAAFDANAARVLARLFDLDRATPGLAESLLPHGRAADWNEAVMDLGALVCVPRAPRCALCPLADLCAGRQAGRAASLPCKPVRRPRPEVEVTTLVLRDGAGRLGLVQRPSAGLLAGMWECPSVEGGASPAEVARRHSLDLCGEVEPLPALRYTFTHRIWRVRPYRAVGHGPVRWVDAAEMRELPLGGPSARLAVAEGARIAVPK